ncbi:MAG: right-handed parallel beta-helix repeat-containing protein, partial [Planctomycetota bacterium]
GWITLRADDGHRPILDGTSVTGDNMVLIDNRSFVRLVGFEIRNNLAVTDGSGVRILGSGSHIEIRDCEIHDIRGADAMGITVYGTSTTSSISEIIIDGNEIYDCDPAQSEALTLNGNVERFEVTNNTVRDVNNIGIDFIGGETDINPTFVARNGICRGNTVMRARANYGGGYGAGIYVDGAQDILIEGNRVTQCDLGIEIGAENAGINATGIVVRDNLVYANDKVGIVFGGYSATVGRTIGCSFRNNTCYGNDTLQTGVGELWIQHASGNDIRNNIFFAGTQNVLLYSELGNSNNTLDHNLWFTAAGSQSATFVWRTTAYSNWTTYRNGSGQDASSQFVDPALRAPGADDFRLLASSPAVEAGDPNPLGAGDQDILGYPRSADGNLDGNARIDQGAIEFSHITMAITGNATPGGQLLIDLDGTAGMLTLLALAQSEAVIDLPPFGTLFFDPTAPTTVLVPAGPLPTQLSVPIPTTGVMGTFLFQAAGIQVTGGLVGNTSKRIDVELD